MMPRKGEMKEKCAINKKNHCKKKVYDLFLTTAKCILVIPLYVIFQRCEPNSIYFDMQVIVS